MKSQRIEYEDMIGFVFDRVTIEKDKDFHRPTHDGLDCITFVRSDGVSIVFRHDQECCEAVFVEDINGDLQSLAGKPLRVAEMYTTDVPNHECEDVKDLYTFYRFANEDVFVTVRWHGSSNGYYSVDVEKYTTDCGSK